MRFSMIACAGVIAAIGTVAFASNNTTFGPNQGPISNPGTPFMPSDCATGFNKSGVTGSPGEGSYGWTCKTPLIVCPPAPPGMTGGLVTPTATPSGKGVVFKYFCSWNVPPK
jgi:hypothetical protein